MDIATLAPLAGLALVDSTSFGTLVLPVIMLARPDLRPRNLLLYLATICTFYWLLGLVLLTGLSTALGAVQLPAGPGIDRAQLVLGVGLLGFSFLIDGAAKRRRHARRAAQGLPPKESRRNGWAERVIGTRARLGTVMAVALAAGLVEAASMLPYLGAIGLLQRSGLASTGQAGVLAGYVLLMVVPALALLALRLVAARAVMPLLGRIQAWSAKNADDLLSWVIGILGVLLALDAWGRLQEAGLSPLPW